MSKIKICHISTMLNWGGVERLLLDSFSSQLLTENSKYVHSLLSPYPGNQDLVSVLEQINMNACFINRAFQYDPRVVNKMVRWLKTNDVNIVHSYNGLSNTWAVTATRFFRPCYFIASNHGSLWSLRPPLSWFEYFAYRFADLVITPSEAGSVMLNYFAKVPKAKIRVLHNGITQPPKNCSKNIRTKMGWGNEFIVGGIGRFAELKGFSLFVEAAKYVVQERKDVRFVLIGDGEKFTEIQAQIETYGLGENFTLTGWRSDAREILAAFDLFVSTSIHEAFGIALVEAASVGIPAIAPKVDSISDIVVHDSTGILLAPSEPAARYFSVQARRKFGRYVVIDGKPQPARVLNPKLLAETILDMIDRSDTRLEYGQNARLRAQSLFSIDKYIQSLFEIYKELSC